MSNAFQCDMRLTGASGIVILSHDTITCASDILTDLNLETCRAYNRLVFDVSSRWMEMGY